MNDRLSPQAIEAERSVLGGVLIDSNALIEASDILMPADFYHEKHGVIFEAMLELQKQRTAIDLITLGEHLRKAGKFDSVGGGGYLAGLMADVPTATHTEHYAKMVSATARRRRLIGVAGKVASAAHEETDPAVAEDRASSMLLEVLSQAKTTSQVYSPDQQADIIVKLLERRSQGEAPGVPTGFVGLDRATGGLRKGDLIIIAARPSVGKSTLAECVAENVAAQCKGTEWVMFISAEMSIEQMEFRVIARSGRLSSAALAAGPTQDAEWDALWQVAQERATLPLYVADSPGVTTTGIRAIINREAMSHGCPPSLVVIDYLQLLGDKADGASDNSRVAAMSRAIKHIAREFSVPVILLSQLSRGVEGRQDKEPKLSDLRDSGAIEQDADLVIFLWNEEHSDPYLPSTRMKIGKQRNGPLAEIDILFHKPIFKFTDA